MPLLPRPRRGSGHGPPPLGPRCPPRPPPRGRLRRRRRRRLVPRRLAVLRFGSVPAEVCRAAGGSRAAREREGEQALARAVLRAVLLCWYFISAAAGMPLPAA